MDCRVEVEKRSGHECRANVDKAKDAYRLTIRYVPAGASVLYQLYIINLESTRERKQDRNKEEQRSKQERERERRNRILGVLA